MSGKDLLSLGVKTMHQSVDVSYEFTRNRSSTARSRSENMCRGPARAKKKNKCGFPIKASSVANVFPSVLVPSLLQWNKEVCPSCQTITFPSVHTDFLIQTPPRHDRRDYGMYTGCRIFFLRVCFTVEEQNVGERRRRLGKGVSTIT